MGGCTCIGFSIYRVTRSYSSWIRIIFASAISSASWCAVCLVLCIHVALLVNLSAVIIRRYPFLLCIRDHVVPLCQLLVVFMFSDESRLSSENCVSPRPLPSHSLSMSRSPWSCISGGRYSDNFSSIETVLNVRCAVSIFCYNANPSHACIPTKTLGISIGIWGSTRSSSR